MVSIIIPVYNSATTVRQSIESIINQTYRTLEIIICDDASTDNSYQIISNLTDNRIKIYQNKINQGYLRTINILFSLCKGEFIAFQDADDLSYPHRIQIQLDQLKNRNLDLIGSNYIIINKEGRKISGVKKMVEDPVFIGNNLINKNLFQKPSILFKRKILSHVGGFREEFLKLKNISEDYDWLLRINEIGFKMGNANYKDPLYQYRSIPSSMSKDVTNIEQFFGPYFAQYLASERRKTGSDSIEKGDINKLFTVMDELKIPFVKDPSLFYRKKAEVLMSSGLTESAIKVALKGIYKSPLKLINYRNLQYCLRKSIFGK